MLRGALVLAAVAALALPASAGAAFPGGNGRFAYFEGDSGGVTPYGLRVDGNPNVVGPFCQEGLSNNCASNPSWSADGTRLAYDLSDGRFLTSTPAGTLSRSFSFPGLVAKRPAFSPTGLQLVFEGVAGGKSQLYSVNANGTGLRKLTGKGGGQPSWSAGGRIAFRRAKNLYVMNGDGSGVRRLTSRGASTPDWSPNSSQIAFTRGGNLYRIRVSTKRLAQLTRKRGIAEPVWRPDGQRIAYQRAPSGDRFQSIIYSARLDGTVQRQERTGGEGRGGFRVYQPSIEPVN